MSVPPSGEITKRVFFRCSSELRLELASKLEKLRLELLFWEKVQQVYSWKSLGHRLHAMSSDGFENVKVYA